MTEASTWRDGGTTQWAILPFFRVYFPLLGVAVASLSRIKDDVERYRSSFRKAVRLLFALTLPALAFQLVSAHDVILLLLGGKWMAAVPLFQVLTVGALVGAPNWVMRWVYMSEGRTRRQLTWWLISAPVMIGAVAAGLPWGALGVAVGSTAAACVLVAPGVLFALSGSRLTMGDVVVGLWRPAVAATVAGLATVAVNLVMPQIPILILRLAASAAFFGAMYLGCWCVTSRSRQEVREMLGVVRLLRSR